MNGIPAPHRIAAALPEIAKAKRTTCASSPARFRPSSAVSVASSAAQIRSICSRSKHPVRVFRSFNIGKWGFATNRPACIARLNARRRIASSRFISAFDASALSGRDECAQRSRRDGGHLACSPKNGSRWSRNFAARILQRLPAVGRVVVLHVRERLPHRQSSQRSLGPQPRVNPERCGGARQSPVRDGVGDERRHSASSGLRYPSGVMLCAHQTGGKSL
jgi:hypothetical protein